MYSHEFCFYKPYNNELKKCYKPILKESKDLNQILFDKIQPRKNLHDVNNLEGISLVKHVKGKALANIPKTVISNLFPALNHMNELALLSLYHKLQQDNE
eukprot:TRINITY_DN1689_c0_g1_i1.p1 TRINITY_DN1689_c0_g1~~TRINITY_DN1689_c0_g1_i1.p1  ORF type:complete len:112 (+),score=20.33 TRINITY_DN1689_c0_g1_i1:37-336(+)